MNPGFSPTENIYTALEQELWNQKIKIKTLNDVWVLSREIARNFTLEFPHNLYKSLQKE